MALGKLLFHKTVKFQSILFHHLLMFIYKKRSLTTLTSQVLKNELITYDTYLVGRHLFPLRNTDQSHLGTDQGFSCFDFFPLPYQKPGEFSTPLHMTPTSDPATPGEVGNSKKLETNQGLSYLNKGLRATSKVLQPPKVSLEGLKAVVKSLLRLSFESIQKSRTLVQKNLYHSI